MTETVLRLQGWQFAPLYVALESGVVNMEGKVLLVVMDVELTLRPEGGTDTEFVPVVLSGDIEHLRLVLLYARPLAGGPAVWCKYTNMVITSTLPGIILGVFTKDAL